METGIENNRAVIEQLMQSTHEDALVKNDIQTSRWMSYKEENEQLSSRLLMLRDKLKHEIMVPVTKKALLRGNLVHTNEVLVSLGDSWFVKQSAYEAAEICKRRIQECDNMLFKLAKEKDLLISRKTFPLENDVFGGRDELIETYDEEEEMKWREKHKSSLRRYRQNLAAERRKEMEKEKAKREKDSEDIFKMLDALELKEEEQDELNRMDVDECKEEFVQNYIKQQLGKDNENSIQNTCLTDVANTKHQHANNVSDIKDNDKKEQKLTDKDTKNIENSSISNSNLSTCNELEVDSGNDIGEEEAEKEEETEDTDDDSDSDYEEESEECCNEDELYRRFQNVVFSDKPTSPKAQKGKVREVSFGDQNNKENKVHLFVTETDVDDFEPLYINFKHSTTENPSNKCSPGEINSPSDIYEYYKKFSQGPKSIMKKSKSTPVDLDRDQFPTEVIQRQQSESNIQVVGNVIEHNVASSQVTEQKRPVSRFKASRMASRK